MTVKTFPLAKFQSFSEKSDPRHVAGRLKALRAELKREGVDAFLIPRADAHRGESVPASEARLAWVTGFTGSAGLAIVGSRKAALFVDSRYTLQAPAQTDTKRIDVIQSLGGAGAEIVNYVPKGGRLAYDPWLHTPGEIKDITAKLGAHATLIASANLVDRIWADRPAPPASAIEFLGPNRTGRATGEKLDTLRADLRPLSADAVVLTLPESICWLFNMRGRDVPNTPFVLAFAIVPRTGKPTVFLSPDQITAEVRKALDGVARIRRKTEFGKVLETLAGKSVLVDPASAPVAVVETLDRVSAKVVEARDPILLPKARKNDAELGGMREAHRHDGLALARFLAWFDKQAPTGELTEIAIVTALEAFRREEPTCVDASFDTIAGAGPNGAIVHYRVTTKTDRILKPGELMLVDSGAQYLSGTTDVTRTLSTGAPGAEEKDRFTRVLKGMIGISTVRFPKGTSGAQIDILARQHLWQVGETYNHGTGHGVGAFLGVHEGPVGISSRYTLPLEPGMVISNEPGFYKTDAYGIRIENLVVVRPSEIGTNFYEFETLTLVPIDRRLIDVGLLTAFERAWIDAYHARVRRELAPALDDETRAWLEAATAPLDG
jgi:Xaa-Pro aminopeptidase